MLEVGKILIAEPFMQDPNFRRAVVLLTDHDSDDGSVGFILNKSLNMKINALVSSFPKFDAIVHYGGPVATDTIHYIHNVGDLLNDSRQIMSGVYWGGNFETLKVLVKNELIKPENIRFYVGYSGWSPNQLAGEMKLGSWVLNHGHPNYIFKSKSKLIWRKALQNKGKNYSVIAQMPDSNILN